VSEPLIEPVPAREPVIYRDTLVLTAVWIRWLEMFQTDTQQRLAALEARVTALETP
jgi:hypothetical protein